MNSAVTLPPRGRLNGAVTLAPGAAQGPELRAGDTLGDGFVITELLNAGAQARVYSAKREGRSYAVKVYGEGYEPPERVRDFLRNVNHPNIAAAIDLGTQSGRWFEVYEYFREGTLEDRGALPFDQIRSAVVPSVNEGLKELHRAGLVHCDIKPSNLFFADDGARVVIGDCGVSGPLNAAGRLIGPPRGTPEYSPRVRMMGGKAIISPAFDYCSLGLVLIRAATGRSFFAGLSPAEIALSYEEGLRLPQNITGRLAVLIRGLVTEDEKKCWGYEEVRRWSEGEFVRPASRRVYAVPEKPRERRPLIFGRFGGETLKITDRAGLVRAVREHWDQGTRMLKRRELLDFLRGLGDGDELARRASELAAQRDANAALFELLALLDESGGLCYMGVCYPTVGDFLDALEGGRDPVARELVLSGLFIRYLRIRGRDKDLVDRLERLISRSGGDVSAVLTLCQALRGGGQTEVFGKTVSDLNGVLLAIADRSPEEINGLLSDESFLAWLNTKGYDREARKLRDWV